MLVSRNITLFPVQKRNASPIERMEYAVLEMQLAAADCIEKAYRLKGRVESLDQVMEKMQKNILLYKGSLETMQGYLSKLSKPDNSIER